MRIRYRASGPSGDSAMRQACHHRPWLTDLRRGTSDARVHLLDHACPWSLTSQMGSVWMLSLSQGVSRMEARMLRHALMGSKWLRHHHCCKAKSLGAGLPSNNSRVEYQEKKIVVTIPIGEMESKVGESDSSKLVRCACG